MAQTVTYTHYFRIWVWLVGLVLLSVFAGTLFSEGGALVVIFAAAWAKAVLVALYYMHLKYERWQLAALVLVPLLLMIGLAFTLFPDIGIGYGK
ncbi:MAG: cytochrome C oxidase subunit IV family protein [Candidatus Binatia bacterium]|nr:cytochrome C oxidase subunit IV family protein [Candidatus Binatia bacterium]